MKSAAKAGALLTLAILLVVVFLGIAANFNDYLSASIYHLFAN